MRCCELPGLRSSWPGGPLGARQLSQEKQATETHFGFETVSEEEKGGKGERGERADGGIYLRSSFFCSARSWFYVVLTRMPWPVQS